MRSILAVAIASAIIGSFSAAQAEKRIFIIGSNADGYRIDQCLATGAGCGNAAATAFCKGRAFRHAVSFHKVDRGDITGAVPNRGASCRGNACSDFLAIECAR